ncbi:MAG TPA: IPT/TIG domain-containing protein [Bryobacteraceae bacterium]|nr:IPT/TIG domain-containing protein [Bryobacteraceae bacterium]
MLAWAASLSPVAAYYHYTHYTPQGVIQEKFDLSQLPNRTLTFFVAQSENLTYSPNDSLPAVLSQIRQAAQAWNATDSELRVAFGGLTQQPPQATPHGLVVFEDIPPGWLAYSTRTVSEPATGGTFVPITQGVVHLNRNLEQKPGPSYLEAFFTTVVHEMGHALGLQHTYTSSAMSTAVTRATSRLKPLDTDDAAAISLLYPNHSVAGNYGSIAGRVTSGGQGVHMASVVAIRPGGSAVSALTNPDGTYRIEWLPAGTYWVYTHALPPNPDMQLPKDAAGLDVPASEPFETLFYPGTRDPQYFSGIAVTGGNAVADIDFAVQRKTSASIYDVAVYSFIGQTAISPAYLDSTARIGTLAALGTGLIGTDGKAVTGLGVQALGGWGNIYSTLAYDNNLALYMTFQGMPTGPQHILFSLPNDAYVLPAAVHLVNRPAPVVTAVVSNPDGTVTIAGSGMNSESKVYIDGTPATIRVPFSGSEEAGTITVVPPAGASQQVAAVAVYNSDGQNSMFTQSQNPPVAAYGITDAPHVTVTPNVLPAGVTSMVEVNGINTNFADGQTTLGFGSSDVFVRRIWVLSPTRLIANVTVAPNAPAGPTVVNVITGFQVFVQPFGFEMQAANPGTPSLTLPLVNVNPGESAIYPGTAVSVSGVNLAAFNIGTTVTLNDQPASVLFASPGQVQFIIPAGLRPGPAILRVHNGVGNVSPVVVQIDAVPVQVNAVLSSGNVSLDVSHPAQAGDVLNVFLANLDAAVASNPSRVRVRVGAIEMPALVIVQAPGQTGVYLAQIILASGATGQVPVTASVDGGAPSAPFYISVR